MGDRRTKSSPSSSRRDVSGPESPPHAQTKVQLADSPEVALTRQAHAHVALKQWRDAASAYVSLLKCSGTANENAFSGIAFVVLEMLDAKSLEGGCNDTLETVMDKLDTVSLNSSTAADAEYAVRCYTDAISLARRSGMETGVIYCLNNLGLRLRYFPRYEEALHCFLAAYGLFLQQDAVTKTSLLDEGDCFKIVSAIATGFFDVRDDTMASYFNEKAATMTSDPADLSEVLILKANILDRSGLLSEALEALATAAAMREHSGLPIGAWMLNRMAFVSGRLGNDAKAVEYYEKAIQVARKERYRGDLARHLVNLSDVYIRMEKWELAQQCLDDADSESDLPQSRMLTEQSRGCLKAEQLKHMDTECDNHSVLAREGAEHFRRARELADQLRLEEMVLQVDVDFGRLLICQRDEAATIHAEAVFREALRKARSREIAIDESLASRIRVYYASCLLKAGCTLDEVSHAVSLLEEVEQYYQTLWRKLGRDEFMVSMRTSSLPINCYDLLVLARLLSSDTNSALETVDRSRSAALMVELSRKRGGTDEADSVDTLRMSAGEMVLYAARLRTTFVIYAVGGDGNDDSSVLMTWVITEGMPEPVFQTSNFREDASHTECTHPERVETARLQDAVQRSIVLSKADAQQRDGLVVDISTASEGGRAPSDEETRRQHRIFWKPIETLIPDHTPIVIFPHGRLWNVPFCLLRDSTGTMLVERCTISVAPSVASLRLVDKLMQHENDEKKRGALVVGNPLVHPPAYVFQTFPSLPAAEDEAKDVADLLNRSGAFDTVMLCAADATKNAVLQRIASCRIVHLATHGFLHAPDQLGYLPGGVVLASPSVDEHKSFHNCLLFSEEVQKLDLSGLALAVLSCCHAGSGDVNSEGLLGFGRALLFAGCRCVIAARWAVPDYETKLLICEFYKAYLLSFDAPLALRQAQQIRRSSGSPASSWGAFYVLGLGRHSANA